MFRTPAKTVYTAAKAAQDSEVTVQRLNFSPIGRARGANQEGNGPSGEFKKMVERSPANSKIGTIANLKKLRDGLAKDLAFSPAAQDDAIGLAELLPILDISNSARATFFRQEFSELFARLNITLEDVEANLASAEEFNTAVRGLGKEFLAHHVAEIAPALARTLTKRCKAVAALGSAVRENRAVPHFLIFALLGDKSVVRGVAESDNFPNQFALIVRLQEYLEYLAGAESGTEDADTAIKAWVALRRERKNWVTDSAGLLEAIEEFEMLHTPGGIPDPEPAAQTRQHRQGATYGTCSKTTRRRTSSQLT